MSTNQAARLQHGHSVLARDRHRTSLTSLGRLDLGVCLLLRCFDGGALWPYDAPSTGLVEVKHDDECRRRTRLPMLATSASATAMASRNVHQNGRDFSRSGPLVSKIVHRKFFPRYNVLITGGERP